MFGEAKAVTFGSGNRWHINRELEFSAPQHSLLQVFVAKATCVFGI